MNDLENLSEQKLNLENQSGENLSGENAGASRDSGAQAQNLERIASTLPPRGDAGVTKTPSGNSEPKKYRHGRPCSAAKISKGIIQPCGNCPTCENLSKTGGKLLGTPVEKPERNSLTTLEPEPIASEPQYSVEDFRKYGEAGAQVIAGIIGKKINPVSREAAEKLGENHPLKIALDRLRLSSPDKSAQLRNLEDFYAACAMELGAPAGGGIILLGISIHYNIFADVNATLGDVRSELAKLAKSPA